jgi:hypothetical protein
VRTGFLVCKATSPCWPPCDAILLGGSIAVVAISIVAGEALGGLQAVPL